jgi:hypothetical protein
MSDFFTAHKARMLRVNQTFIELARQLIDNGCRVFNPKDELINFIVVIKDDDQVTVEWNEVPYRWTMSTALRPTKVLGSGRTLVTRYDPEEPWTKDEVFNHLLPIPILKDKFIEDKLRYLTEFKIVNNEELDMETVSE